jgi:hypothetical protein
MTMYSVFIITQSSRKSEGKFCTESILFTGHKSFGNGEWGMGSKRAESKDS